MAQIHDPLFALPDHSGIGGQIGPEPEDFYVEEIPSYLPSGEGEHLYVLVEKRGISTPELVRRLARAANVDSRDIGYAGLKDKHAITRQWLSLPKSALDPAQWGTLENVEVLSQSRHANKLRTGHLSGNRFRIRLHGVADGALPTAQALAEALRQSGVPNYFGGQRFGRGGENLSRALDWLRGGARARLSSFLVKLYPSVVQSEIFNRYLSLRRSEGLDRLLPGEVVRLNGSHAQFVVEEPEREQPRLAARDIHPTGPIPGPKMRAAQGRALELEALAMQEADVSDAVMQVLGRFAPGTRRDLLVYPEELCVSESKPGQLELSFALPAGSYATVLVREFTRRPLIASDLDERES
ncbi:MAG TPA: tRNA pseudouridine(13) synthase TruD [Polyangiaceae bacterium]|nr:tRNA pseudouridine(13) synthase TruD [Polyangiaceae bacterium]